MLVLDAFGLADVISSLAVRGGRVSQPNQAGDDPTARRRPPDLFTNLDACSFDVGACRGAQCHAIIIGEPRPDSASCTRNASLYNPSARSIRSSRPPSSLVLCYISSDPDRPARFRIAHEHII